MHNHNNSINSDGQNAYSQRPEKPWYSTDPVPSNIELPADPRRYKLIPIDFTMTGNIKIVVYVALGDFCHHIFFFSFFLSYCSGSSSQTTLSHQQLQPPPPPPSMYQGTSQIPSLQIHRGSWLTTFPRKGYQGDIAFDVSSDKEFWLPSCQTKEVETNIRLVIPHGYWVQLCSRSKLAKVGIIVQGEFFLS